MGLVDRLKTFKFQSIARKGKVGVTSFFTRKFRNGRTFKASHKRTTGISGLTLGRIVDHHFRAFCDTGYMPRGSPNTRKWMDNVANACKSQGLRCVRAQVPVYYGSVHTMLDGIGVTSDNKICVIELKCTGQTRSSHRLNYDKTCRDLKSLYHLGKPNTERVAHQYQAGFGVLAFKNTYPEFANEKVIGAVLVACADGAFFYRVTETPDPCHIPINPGALPKSQKTSDLTLNMFVKSSDHENGGQLISELIAREGFTRLEDSGTLLKARAFDGKVAFFGIYPHFKTVGQSKRMKAVNALKTSRPKQNTKFFIVHKGDKGWGLTLVGRKK